MASVDTVRELHQSEEIKYVFSAMCAHALRWGWLTRNPVHGARQSAKGKRRKIPLTVEEVQALMLRLEHMDRLLVLLDVPTGLRVSELLALRWRDVDLDARVVKIRGSIWHQQVGGTNTPLSESEMPLKLGFPVHWPSEIMTVESPTVSAECMTLSAGGCIPLAQAPGGASL